MHKFFTRIHCKILPCHTVHHQYNRCQSQQISFCATLHVFNSTTPIKSFIVTIIAIFPNCYNDNNDCNKHRQPKQVHHRLLPGWAKQISHTKVKGKNDYNSTSEIGLLLAVHHMFTYILYFKWQLCKNLHIMYVRFLCLRSLSPVSVLVSVSCHQFFLSFCKNQAWVNNYNCNCNSTVITYSLRM